jgi:hypothetical protein
MLPLGLISKSQSTFKRSVSLAPRLYLVLDDKSKSPTLQTQNAFHIYCNKYLNSLTETEKKKWKPAAVLEISFLSLSP